jgi:DNA-binding NarL/FixJ family response regulator
MKINLMIVAWEEPPSPDWLTLQNESVVDRTIVANAIAPRDVLTRLGAGTPPDVLLMAFDEARATNVWRVLSSVERLSPGTKVILTCKSSSPLRVIDFIRHGVSGCMPASSSPAMFAKAVRSVHAGQTWFGRSDLLEAIRSQIGASSLAVPIVVPADEPLTAREREIMALIGCAMSNKEIARRLQISAATVKTHLHRIYVKLDQSGRYKALLSGPDRHRA